MSPTRAGSSHSSSVRNIILNGIELKDGSDKISIYSIDKEPKHTKIPLPFKPSHQCMVQFDEQYYMLIGYDTESKINRFRIFDLVAKTWQPERQDDIFPVNSQIGNQLFCDAFKADGKTTIFLSGHGYNTFLYDVASRKWTTGEFKIAVKYQN